MIVVMDGEAPESAVEAVVAYLVHAGFDVHRSSGQTHTILGAVGSVSTDDIDVVRDFPGVAKVVRVSEPFSLASRRFKPSSSVLSGEFGTIGGGKPWIALEPIGLEDTSEGRVAPLRYDVAAARAFDAAVTRARVAPEAVGSLACLSLHAAPAQAKFPVVFVAREPSWGADLWIQAAERELKRSGTEVALLEAGGEYPSGARTLEVAAMGRAKRRTHLPIVVDAPIVAQQARYVGAVACAAVGAGADGVILRVWVGPDNRTPRVAATLRWDEAVDLVRRLRAIGDVLA